MANVRLGAIVEGGENLLKQLKAADGNVKKSVKGAVRAGTKVIGAAANANANAISHKPGKKVSVRVRMRHGFAVGSVFPAKGHAELRVIEYGTSVGRRWAKFGHKFKFYAGNRLVETASIQHPGTPARPWLRPAFDTSTGAATTAVGESLRQAVESARIAQEGQDS